MAIDTNIALISLNEAKQFLKLTVNTEDDLVGDTVNAVSDWINKYCDRKFLSAERTEYYNGNGTSELALKNFPVTAIGSLYDDPLRAFGASTLIPSTDYILDGNAGLVQLFNGHTNFFEGFQNIKITYTAGYAVDSTMPYAVQMACKILTSLIYRNVYVQWRVGIASEQVGDKTVTFRDEEVPKMVKSMLDPFRMIGGNFR